MTRIVDQDYKLLSGYAMPVLGLGTWGLVGSACERTVSKALELGYRHIDTAALYGNETQIARAIRHVERASLFLTSKVASEHLRSDDVLRACSQSLERLGTDYLDLYLIHWPNDEIPIEETMEAMATLVEQGKVRSVGVSNFDADRVQEAIDASDVPVCNDQVEYHPFRPRRELPEFCREHDIALSAYSPLAKGRVLRDPVLTRIGRKYGKSAGQVSLRWLLQKGAIVIPKAGSVEHLQENLDMDGWELSPEDMREIDEIGVEMKLVDTTYT